MTVWQLYRFLDSRYPRSLSCEWDNDGLQCCPDAAAELSGSPILLTLDVTAEAVEEARRIGARLILSHHPLLFRPLKALTDTDPKGALLLRLIREGIAVACFHTRLDSHGEGVGQCLASALCLEQIESFDVDGFPMGRIGLLPKGLRGSFPEALALFLKESLSCREVSFVSAGKPITRLAVVGGSGSDGIASAAAMGADAFVTGDVSYNTLMDWREAGLSVFRCGHFETEQPVLAQLKAAVKDADPLQETVCFSATRIQTV